MATGDEILRSPTTTDEEMDDEQLKRVPREMRALNSRLDCQAKEAAIANSNISAFVTTHFRNDIIKYLNMSLAS